MEGDHQLTEELRLQFQALQQQQQQRVGRMLAKKREREREEQQQQQRMESRRKEEGGKEEGLSISFGVEDEMNLQLLSDQTDPHMDRILENENEVLRGQVRELLDENGRLYKLLNERDFEIKHLKKKREEERLALAGTAGIAGDVAATKIVELSKRNRELVAECESNKTKVKQLNSKMRELEKELQTALANGQSPVSAGPMARVTKDLSPRTKDGSLVSSDNPEVKALQEKLCSTNLKLVESRNQIQSIKQELKMAHKVLTNEVGEEINVQRLLSNGGHWRGRAEQIQVLQKKVRELENQLRQNIQKDHSLDQITEEGTLSWHPPGQDRNIAHIRAMEKERKGALEKMTSDHELLQKDHEDLRQRLDGVKARNKILTVEVKTLKGQIVTLLEKGKHDDELVTVLMDYYQACGIRKLAQGFSLPGIEPRSLACQKQQKQLHEFVDHLNQQEMKSKVTEQNLSQQLSTETQAHTSLIGQLRQMVSEREAKVKELEDEVKQLVHKQQQKVLDAEAQYPSSPPHMDSFGEYSLHRTATGEDQTAGRFLSARSVSAMGHTLIEPPAAQSQSITATGTISSVNGIDINTLQLQCTQYKSLYQAVEVERDKLLELVSVLQKRLEGGSEKLLEAEQKIQEMRRRSAILEQQLGKAKLQANKNNNKNKPNLTSSGGRQGLNPLSGRDVAPAIPMSSDTQQEELNTRLTIQMDENAALKTALQSTLKAKQEDLTLYQDMISQIKQVFLQAIRQHKDKH